MWSIRRKGDLTAGRDKIISSILLVILLLATLSVYTGEEPGYTPITQKCISCHNDTTYPQDTDLDGYSAPYKRPHNNSVMCEYCHTIELHDMKYVQPDGTFGQKETSAKCPDCHQASINNSNFSYAPLIPGILKHSSDISNGSIWGNYWASTADACIYCHGDTKHNVNGLGKIKQSLLLDTNNTRNGNPTDTTWCADCHYNNSNQNYIGTLNISGGPTYALITGGVSYTFSPVPVLITFDNSNRSGWMNHSGYLTGGYKDSICAACHALNGSFISTSLNYSHSLDTGLAGGPDCVNCHDPQGSAGTGRLVNTSAMNDPDSLHKDLNSGVSSNLSALNKKCWACHGNGSEPGSGHPSTYRTPYLCPDCHVPSISQNLDYTPPDIQNVTQHYWNGTSISTSAVNSCNDCHNKSEMMLGENLDPDGPASVYGGKNGGDGSVSHYGRKRWDYPGQGSNEYCKKCHNNESTVFPFSDPANKMIANHSSTYSAANPLCISCHYSGRIHNDTLFKPALTLPNSTYCLSCHGRDGSATIKNFDRHNGTLDCTQCHMDYPGNIHPVGYLQSTGTSWNLSRTNAVNCTNCHQTPGFLNAPIIPDPLKHSSNAANGTIWGNYWTFENGSCYYCHNNTKHNATALGGISTLLLDLNNSRNGILTNTTWCADCHYNDSVNVNYRGNRWIPTPVLITVDNSNKSGWVNHSNYVSEGYRDNNCQACHALKGTYLPTSLNYSHSLDTGIGGGPNCILCHFNGSVYHNIDIDTANMSAHFGMNRENATKTGIAPVNGACWGCHDSDGNISNNRIEDLMGDIYNRPKKCDDCHLSSGSYYSQAVSWGGLTVTRHFYNNSEIIAGNSSSNISSCITCHENTSEMTLPNNDIDYGTFSGDGVRLTGGNMSFYHYGKRRNDLRTVISGLNFTDCLYCHKNQTTAFTNAMQRPNISKNIFNHTDNQLNQCMDCHGAGWIHNSTLQKPSLNNSFCLSCHMLAFNSTKSINETHNSTSMNCWNCHQDPGGGMIQAPAHGMMYPQENGSYMRYDRGTPANCTTCHVLDLVNTSAGTATRIPGLNHSSDPSSGMKWGNYWNNTSMVTACYYCHQPDIHNSTVSLLGNVSKVKGSNTYKNQDLTTSRWCASCHYNNSSYKGDIFINPPPEITNSSLNAGDGTPFFNHSGFPDYNDSACLNCHGALQKDTLNFSHSVSEGGGGPDCIICHDKKGMGAPPDKRIDAASIKLGLHRDLNSNANTSQEIDNINKACWACHGDGNEPSGHPERYKNPRKCQSNECHSLAQSRFNEPMIYSHFRNSSLNDNPGNSTNYNITTSEECSSCHINSVLITDNNTANALVSHYGSKEELVDSFNCRYCHLDKDQSEDWGNATLINKERTSLISLDKEGNKLKISDGETLYLGEGYFLKLLEVSENRNSALIQLIREDKMVDETLVVAGTPYQYEKDITIDNSTFKTPIIIINITSIFKSDLRSFIQFEGSRIRKIHTEKEGGNNSACFACHLYRYSNEKQRYQVIDREYDENPSKDIIYFIQVLMDFKPGNKSKIYFNDENDIFDQIDSGKSVLYSTPQKFLKEGEIWNITKNYYLRLDGVSSNGQEAILTLKINDIVEQQLIKTNTEFNFTPALRYKESGGINLTVFSANVSAIGKGSMNFIILKNVLAKSPVVMKSTADTKMLGYNASWYRPDDRFMAGRIPENLHSPNLYTDQMGWTDCVKCHDESKNLMITSINAISSRLGKHSKLNENASNMNILSDPIDKACWACHTQGKETQSHSPTYISPRNCRSCHVYQEEPTYGAINISGEPHALETACENCHMIDSHILARYQVTPVIMKAILSKTTVGIGETIEITANANAGYGMRIQAAEYFIDTKGAPGAGVPILPLDGTFDFQKEDLTAFIDTTGLTAGEHTAYVHAMERNNRWGEDFILSFEVIGDFGTTGRSDENPEITTFVESDLNTTDWSIILVVAVSIAVYILIKNRRLW